MPLNLFIAWWYSHRCFHFLTIPIVWDMTLYILTVTKVLEGPAASIFRAFYDEDESNRFSQSVPNFYTNCIPSENTIFFILTAVNISNSKSLPLIVQKCKPSKVRSFRVITESLCGPLSFLCNVFACFRDPNLSRPWEPVEVKNTQSFACKSHALLEHRHQSNFHRYLNLFPSVSCVSLLKQYLIRNQVKKWIQISFFFSWQ